MIPGPASIFRPWMCMSFGTDECVELFCKRDGNAVLNRKIVAFRSDETSLSGVHGESGNRATFRNQSGNARIAVASWSQGVGFRCSWVWVRWWGGAKPVDRRVRGLAQGRGRRVAAFGTCVPWIGLQKPESVKECVRWYCRNHRGNVR